METPMKTAGMGELVHAIGKANQSEVFTCRCERLKDSGIKGFILNLLRK